MTEMCIKCKEESEDHRTLWMSCLYEMNELNIPFTQVEMAEPLSGLPCFYTLRVCKNCRADWMRAIQYWWNTEMPRKSCGSGIFVRDFGSNKEITLEEFRKRYGDNVRPTIVLKDFKEE